MPMGFHYQTNAAIEIYFSIISVLKGDNLGKKSLFFARARALTPYTLRNPHQFSRVYFAHYQAYFFLKIQFHTVR